MGVHLEGIVRNRHLISRRVRHGVERPGVGPLVLDREDGGAVLRVWRRRDEPQVEGGKVTRACGAAVGENPPVAQVDLEREVDRVEQHPRPRIALRLIDGLPVHGGSASGQEPLTVQAEGIVVREGDRSRVSILRDRLLAPRDARDPEARQVPPGARETSSRTAVVREGKARPDPHSCRRGPKAQVVRRGSIGAHPERTGHGADGPFRRDYGRREDRTGIGTEEDRRHSRSGSYGRTVCPGGGHARR